VRCGKRVPRECTVLSRAMLGEIQLLEDKNTRQRDYNVPQRESPISFGYVKLPKELLLKIRVHIGLTPEPGLNYSKVGASNTATKTRGKQRPRNYLHK